MGCQWDLPSRFADCDRGVDFMRILRSPLILCLVGGLALSSLSMAREKSISLNGDWNFVADPTGKLTIADLATVPNVRPTRVPSSWQEQFADLRDYAGRAWYWRTLKLDARPDASHQAALLRFGAVDYLADVYVNGQKVGSHEGGYLPFEFDVAMHLQTGENLIAVRVVDASAGVKEVEGIKYEEIPHGKQNWYVETSGLWQDVVLEIRPKMYLRTVHITAGMDGKFRIQVVVNNVTVDLPIAETLRVKAHITDAGGKEVWSGAAELKRDQATYEILGALSNPNLWWVHNPALYTLHVSLPTGDARDYRSFEARGAKFYLNGHVIYLRAPLDQDFYPDTIYTPPSYEYLKNQLQQAKALGFNMMRCHIKVPDPRYLDAADEVGLLVWYEIPNWDKLTEDSKLRGRETLAGMIERDWNHPSIVIVSVINESWGVNLKDPKEAAQREWLKAEYAAAKKMVPGWLVVDNSACCDNFHMATDIADFHQYNAVPDHASDFDRFVGDMARRPGWLFSPFNDAAPRGDEPLVLSEFGNWGLPRLGADKPWWFDRPFAFERTITLPGGVEHRFADHGFGSIFADYNALADATQAHQFRALKHEIESIRARPELEGYVITEFTDLNWEANGVLDMWRRPKSYAADLARLQQDDLLIARTERRNLTAGDRGQAAISFSHYSLDSLSGAQVEWELEGTETKRTLALPSVAVGSVVNVGKAEFIAPSVTAPAKRLLRVRLTAGTKTVSETSLEFFFYPRKAPDLPPPVSFHDPAGRLRRLVNEMRARNYLAPTGKETFPVLIASAFDDKVKQTLRQGGRVILLASDKQTLAPGVEIVPRSGSFLDGNWISSYLWIRKDQEPFKIVGFETLPGFEVQSVAPSTVVHGIQPADFDDVLSGIFYGWIHSNVGTLVQARAGQGKLLICTYSLATTYGSDPYATYLLDALVRYIVTGPVPKLEIPL
jgi:hypothetical protein